MNMTKTKEELKELKEEYEALKEKLNELSEDEVMSVTGGTYKKDIGADKNAKVIFDLD